MTGTARSSPRLCGPLEKGVKGEASAAGALRERALTSGYQHLELVHARTKQASPGAHQTFAHPAESHSSRQLLGADGRRARTLSAALSLA